MKQVRPFSDLRQRQWCPYCGSSGSDTRDHIPPKILLNRPFPSNLPVVNSCKKCNESFSIDDEYLSMLIRCAVAGPLVAALKIDRIASLAKARPGLLEIIKASETVINGSTAYFADHDRVSRSLERLVKGHIYHEFNEPVFDQECRASYTSLHALSIEDREQWEASNLPDVFPEIGSPGMQRLIEGQDIDQLGWVHVQKGVYRYRVTQNQVDIVILECLAASALWNNTN